ncbi:hypothetical protein [uncultured Azohydromonas sp.]|uniref:hypothetical protein n=1 Tax=uncultured Azohydromonas sp. TaxID=487342 RepID=UPI002631793B|nr:hypothetical protein [uncultured Azohydromonas sp.]
MTVQTLIVGLLVAWALVYAVWVLMPAALKRGLLGPLQRHWPGLARRVAPAGGGCGGCNSCGPAPAKGAQAEAKPVQLHLKRRH